MRSRAILNVSVTSLFAVFVKPDVAIADLQKAKISSRGKGDPVFAIWARVFDDEDAAAYRPKHSRAGPCHAFEETAAINAVMFVVVRNVIGHNICFWLTDWYLFYICPYRSGSRLFPKILEG